MRMPWSKQTKESQPTMDKSTAALTGAAGDGLEHDLQYWLNSGFLTLPQGAIDAHTARIERSDGGQVSPPAPRRTPQPGAQDQPL